MYRRIPYIIYIPDAYDKEIENSYQRTYYELIQSLQNGSLYFENIFFDIKEVVNKIKYYIDNNFILESQLEKFYEAFDLRKGKISMNLLNILLILSKFLNLIYS